MLDFFSLGETFLGIGMRLGGGIMQFKMFGNLAHPTVLQLAAAKPSIHRWTKGGQGAQWSVGGHWQNRGI